MIGTKLDAVRAIHPRERCVARLVCFPWAGGAANGFAALSAELAADVELLAVQYPGRQDRRAEPCAADIGALAREAVRSLAPYTGLPLFLLGHSMGALVAFEAARLLEPRVRLVRLFASAARPPADDWGEPDLDRLDDEMVLAELRRLGGLPEQLLADTDVVAEVVRVVRGDLRAFRRYSCPPDAALAAPITVLLAEDDPKNSVEQVRGWARHTTAGFTLDVVPGGHFALTDGASGASRRIAARIREDLAPARADLVREVYLAGARGRTPRLPTDLTRLQDEARAVLAPTAYAYVAGDAGTGATGRANRQAFDRWRLVARMLRGAVKRDLAVSLFGQDLPAPVLLAPVAAQTVIHPEGELATARGAADAGVPFVLSTGSCHSLEDVAAVAGGAGRWFQLYWPSDQAVCESLVRRAEASGYSALVVTVDTPTFGYRPSDLDNGYLPFLNGAGIANFTSDPVFRAGLPPDPDRRTVVGRWAAIFANPGLTWDHLPWLRALTRLPILLKGILHPDDARRAVELGADGVVVSNHGGRQLDGSIASLDALPAVRSAVGPGVAVLLDSGIRTGSDVVKALALGADAVLYGRPYLYGLALDGSAGVTHVLRCLLAELDLALAITGCARVSDVTRDLVVPPGPLDADGEVASR